MIYLAHAACDDQLGSRGAGERRRLPLDAGEFRRQGRQVVDFIADYYARIDDYPASTELEVVVTDWLGKALHLPEKLLFGGGGGGGGTLLGTSCEAMLCVIVAARDEKLAVIGDLVVYFSDQTHFSFKKAARIAGIRRGNCREIPTPREDAFALTAAALIAAVNADVAAGRVPLLLCATVGTTATAAVDPVRELCAAVEGRGVWVHVDAAYAGAACVCPEHRHVIAGATSVDSLSTNPHKWLLANMDCCALCVSRPATLGTDDDVILKDAAARARGVVVDYKDWQVSLSRRFRALKLWLVLRCHGVDGLRDVVRGHVRMAASFERMVRADPRFEVPVPRRFALVCFRLRDAEDSKGAHGEFTVSSNEANRRLLEAVNGTGART
uniref:Tyrosine decarboxylase n=1 Tax=Leersia perrieri TaxID=77586 RepID=A0A0D9WII4_9ORYZ